MTTLNQVSLARALRHFVIFRLCWKMSRFRQFSAEIFSVLAFKGLREESVYAAGPTCVFLFK